MFALHLVHGMYAHHFKENVSYIENISQIRNNNNNNNKDL